MKAIGQITVAIIVGALMAIAFANVFAYQWNSLMVPAFGIFKITATQAYILFAVKGLLFYKTPKDEGEDVTTILLKQILNGGFICLISLLFTWVTALILF